ncbi:MAG: hypothetical protein EZS28_019696 [Streblomastix strix]|uniref:Uncharacterized protein n=1 Tax=Streblomastix strix TaxID=222440 RepID=A0A5J4VQ49_9EUKA|nr:MAG: hypothetical protein EZS28_019696 [Streblomastix strix]
MVYIVTDVMIGSSTIAPEQKEHKTALYAEDQDVTLLVTTNVNTTASISSSSEQASVGTVPIFENLSVNITFDSTSLPQPPPNYSAFCSMYVDGSGDKALRITGEVPESKAVFFIEQHDTILTVSPLSGVVPVGGQAEIAMTVRASANKKITGSIIVSIRGNMQIQLPIATEALEPNVEIVENKIDFGDVIVDPSDQSEFALSVKEVKVLSANGSQESSTLTQTQSPASRGQTSFIIPLENDDTIVLMPTAQSDIPFDLRCAMCRRMGKPEPVLITTQQKKKQSAGSININATSSAQLGSGTLNPGKGQRRSVLMGKQADGSGEDEQGGDAIGEFDESEFDDLVGSGGDNM